MTDDDAVDESAAETPAPGLSEPERRPNPWVLLVIALVVLGVALAIGIGWR